MSRRLVTAVIAVVLVFLVGSGACVLLSGQRGDGDAPPGAAPHEDDQAAASEGSTPTRRRVRVPPNASGIESESTSSEEPDAPATDAAKTDAGLVPSRPRPRQPRDGFRVTGRCVDEAGQPVSDVRLNSKALERRTDKRGRFIVVGLFPDAGRVIVTPAHHAPFVLDGITEEKDVDVGDLVLRKGLELRGLVIGPDGTPEPNVFIRVHPSSGHTWSRTTKTSPDGRFHLRALPDEELKLTAEIRNGEHGSRTTTLPSVRAGDVELQVALPRGLHVRLRFVSDADGSPLTISTGSVQIYGESGFVTGRGWHGRDAELYLLGVDEPGTYTARVSAPGYEKVRTEPFEIVEHQDTDVEVRLVPKNDGE